MSSFADRRTTMVDTQIRPSDVTKYPIIDAMLEVPRELYVPDSQREVAYVGRNIPLADGRVLLEPRTLAKMLDVLNIQPNELVLDVAVGPGYSTAVVAQLAEAVVGVEEDESMAADAEATLSSEGVDNAAIVRGSLAEGAPQHGPYDVILVQGGVEALPDGFTNQLKDGARIACIFMEGALGTVRIGYKLDGVVNWRFGFNSAAPVLPGFSKGLSFAL